MVMMVRAQVGHPVGQPQVIPVPGDLQKGLEPEVR